MGLPVLPQHRQAGFWQGNITIFVPLSLLDVEQFALSIDLGYLQVDSF
jgi:hypothetical protein